MGYTKLFSTIIHSTVWREPDHVRLLWITMLALADRDGQVDASVPGLADAARISLEQCLDGLRRFQEPDTYSRSHAYDGRRIEEVDGGWRLLNHEKYRNKLDLIEARRNAAERKARSRARAAAVEPGEKRSAISTSVTKSHKKSRQAAPAAAATPSPEASPSPDQTKEAAVHDPTTTESPLVLEARELERRRSSNLVNCLVCGHPWRLVRHLDGDFYGHGRVGGPTGCRETCPAEEYAVRAAVPPVREPDYPDPYPLHPSQVEAFAKADAEEEAGS